MDGPSRCSDQGFPPRTDEWGRPLDVGADGQVVPTVYLHDIRFRRYDFIRRHPLSRVRDVAARLNQYLDEVVFTEPDEHGGRRVRDPDGMPHHMAFFGFEARRLREAANELAGKEATDERGGTPDPAA